MQRKSLVQAKAGLSALVDQAEHHETTTIILRHGKPAAALVPVDVALGRRRSIKARRPTKGEVDRLFGGFGEAEPGESAVLDLLRGRR